ncbi:MAG: hypothetical protein OEL88_01155 [Sterolibacteriaceae bacterium MAG5]|nr:hypothetical protein [Candidatus Nitricoxidireducens bremensis]
MKDLAWRAANREELATLLTEARQVSSQAVGEATVYRLTGDHPEFLAISLPGGQAVVVEVAPSPGIKRRRRADTT